MNHKLIFLLFLIIVSCSSNFNNAHLSIFKYNESAGVYTLDPAFSKDQATVNIANQIFNGLVQLDENLNIAPSIASSWLISEDALEYKFILRDDVYFHDHNIFKEGKGRRVVASDFKYSFERLRDKDIVSPGGWILNNIEDFYDLKVQQNKNLFSILEGNPSDIFKFYLKVDFQILL